MSDWNFKNSNQNDKHRNKMTANKAPNITDVLFKGINGSLPLILYVAPVLIWTMLFIFLGFNPKAIARSAIATSVSNTLQEDINLISEKADNKDFLNMSKDDIIKSNKSEHFLLEKAKRKIEKSKASQSFGSNDYDAIEFDEALNPIFSEPIDSTQEAAIDVADLNYEMDKLKEDRERKYQQKRAEIKQREKERKAKIDQAIADNKQKKAAKEQQAYNEYQLEQAAYKQSVAQFHHSNGQGQYDSSNPSYSTKKKQVKSDFSFNTAIGLKDDFDLYEHKTKSVKIDSSHTKRPRAVNNQNNIASVLTNQIPLYATIDQARKVRNGQKVQIRITEEGFYQGLFIPANSIIYGICSFRQNRLNIMVPSINYDGEVIRTNMLAYDTDGIQGIYVDGKFNDFSKDLINEGLRTGSRIGFTSPNNPLGGLSLNLGRKANNKISVHIPSGYNILLYHGEVETLPSRQLNFRQLNGNQFNNHNYNNAYGY